MRMHWSRRGGHGARLSRTVNSPVSLSMLTWVTCMGLVGVDMVGRRGELTRLLIKVEKVVFFFAPVECRFFALSASSL
jgi:hypothetical protein